MKTKFIRPILEKDLTIPANEKDAAILKKTLAGYKIKVDDAVNYNTKKRGATSSGKEKYL